MRAEAQVPSRSKCPGFARAERSDEGAAGSIHIWILRIGSGRRSPCQCLHPREGLKAVGFKPGEVVHAVRWRGDALRTRRPRRTWEQVIARPYLSLPWRWVPDPGDADEPEMRTGRGSGCRRTA